jgi:PAB1-binding protein PBP1
MKKLFACLIAGFISLPAMALETVRLDSLGASAFGATYVQTIDFADLNTFGAITNVTVGITSAIPAKVGLTMVGMILETAFQDTGALETANATTNSLTISVGDGSVATYYMAATQIAADGTEVFVQFTPVASGTIAITPQTVAITNNGGGPVHAVLTNATAAFTGTRLGQKYYPTGGVVVYTFIGAGLKGAGIPGDVMSAYTSGKLKVFWRELR